MRELPQELLSSAEVVVVDQVDPTSPAREAGIAPRFRIEQAPRLHSSFMMRSSMALNLGCGMAHSLQLWSML